MADPPAARHRRGARPGAADGRARAAARRAELLNELPRLVGEVTEEQIRRRRGHPAAGPPGVIEVVPEESVSATGRARRRWSQCRCRPVGMPAARPNRSSSCRRRPSGRCANGLTGDRGAPAGGAAGRGAAADAVRPRRRLARAQRCCPRRCSPAPATMSQRARSRPSCRRVGGGLSAGLDPDRLIVTGAALGQRAGPDAGDPRRGADRRGVPEPTRSPPSGTGWSTGIQVAQSQPAHLVRDGAAPADLRHATRTRCRRPSREQVRGGTAGAAARPARRPGPPRRRVLVLVGDLDAGPGARTPPRRRCRAGPAPGDRQTLPRRPAAGAGAAAAGRPPGLGAVLAADRRCRRCRAPTRTTPRCSWRT